MRNLSVETIHQLFPGGLERTFDKNQIVCYDGDKPNSVFFILEGHIKLYDIDSEGNEKILHINGPRNIFPMLYAFHVSPDVKGFYSCIDRTKLLIIPLDDFHKAIDDNIEFSNMLISLFLVEIQELVYRLGAMEKTDAHNKILYALKSLTVYYSHLKGPWLTIDFPITRQFMADYTGLARETVSLAMTELERDKVIEKAPLRTLKVKASALPTD